jgi:CHAT domain
MELIIAFSEKPHANGEFVFDLILDGQSHQRELPFVNPLDEDDLKELRWYLEEYLDWPFNSVVKARAENAEQKLERWGVELFRALFEHAEARVLYDRLAECHDAERFLTIQSPDPRVLRLPWELLRDRSGPLVTAGISIRRHVEQGLTPTVPPFALPLRVLYVIARPTDAGFIDPRSSAGGVMDALEPLIEKGLVMVDFVRPGTFEQLGKMLGPERGKYHLLHFDGHGFYDDRLGLGGLAFEDAEHETHLVPARDLGDLLNRSGIALSAR